MKQISLISFYKKYGIYILLVITVAFFSVFAPNFLSVKNLISILRQVAVLGTIVTGLSMVMISGGMDLSVGAQCAMNGVLTAMLLTKTGIPTFLVVLISLAIGLFFGFLNGIISLKLNIMPMIATLGMMLALQGLAQVVSRGYAIYGFPDSFLVLGQGYLFGIIPVPVIIFLVVACLAEFVLSKTYFGRRIYAMGGNREAARLAGVNVDKMHVVVFMLSSLITSIGSIILMARVGSGQPNAGSSYAFDCMSGAVLGGISVAGGEGRIIGAVIGTIIIGVLDNGMLLMGVNPNWQDFVKGVVLVIAVGIDGLNMKKRAKSKTI